MSYRTFLTGVEERILGEYRDLIDDPSALEQRLEKDYERTNVAIQNCKSWGILGVTGIEYDDLIHLKFPLSKLRNELLKDGEHHEVLQVVSLYEVKTALASMAKELQRTNGYIFYEGKFAALHDEETFCGLEFDESNFTVPDAIIALRERAEQSGWQGESFIEMSDLEHEMRGVVKAITINGAEQIVQGYWYNDTIVNGNEKLFARFAEDIIRKGEKVNVGQFVMPSLARIALDSPDMEDRISYFRQIVDANLMPWYSMKKVGVYSTAVVEDYPANYRRVASQVKGLLESCDFFTLRYGIEDSRGIIKEVVVRRAKRFINEPFGIVADFHILDRQSVRSPVDKPLVEDYLGALSEGLGIDLSDDESLKSFAVEGIKTRKEKFHWYTHPYIGAMGQYFGIAQ